MKEPGTNPLPRPRRAIDLTRKNSFHCNIEFEKPTHWFNFWTNVILSVWRNDDNHYTFSIFTYLFSENKRSCWYSRGSRCATEIHFFLSHYQSFVFYRKPSGRPLNKMKKIKRLGQVTFQKTTLCYQDLSKCVHISRFVTHRTSTLPFFLKLPASLVIKLVCLWFLRLAKHIVKWRDVPSYLTQGRVPGSAPLYGRYVQP